MGEGATVPTRAKGAARSAAAGAKLPAAQLAGPATAASVGLATAAGLGSLALALAADALKAGAHDGWASLAARLLAAGLLLAAACIVAVQSRWVIARPRRGEGRRGPEPPQRRADGIPRGPRGGPVLEMQGRAGAFELSQDDSTAWSPR